MRIGLERGLACTSVGNDARGDDPWIYMTEYIHEKAVEYLLVFDAKLLVDAVDMVLHLIKCQV